ncbi:glycine zipper 2TM domain-containing protein [Dyella solisilvae]|uniref:Glycine zipper 2TM domain-containing protein n=1 Tax=Dyella solisilvae TaxID=1920168 RepID=A0A370KAP5_9GAMM|nr:glycine zipper 2TM domain-containing protein [Dyella solisilvae]RDI99661.1 glycine zipper 2TM domain-containing protein [Dyella solisilvae]
MQTLLRHLAVVGLISVLGVLSGCETPPQRQVTYSGSSNRCEQCGVVTDVRQTEQQKSSSPLGMVIGAVAGGVIGNQFGGGTGKALTTAAGVVAGGAIGNQVGKNQGGPDVAWQVTIKLDDGRYATVTQAADPQVRVGDYVQVRNNLVYRL